MPFCFLPPAAKGVSDAEHDDFGDGDSLDEQEGAASEPIVTATPARASIRSRSRSLPSSPSQNVSDDMPRSGGQARRS